MDVSFLFAFLLASLISFVGSLQPGPLNMSVIYTSFHHSKKSAILLALGGVLPEIIYSSIALWINVHTTLIKKIEDYSFYVIIPLLVIIGIYLFQKKTNSTEVKDVLQGEIRKGFFLGMLNPLLLPFWTIWIQQLKQKNILDLNSNLDQIAFVVGTASGAFLLLLLVAVLTIKYRNLIEKFLKDRVNKILGAICFILALIEVIRIAAFV